MALNTSMQRPSIKKFVHKYTVDCQWCTKNDLLERPLWSCKNPWGQRIIIDMDSVYKNQSNSQYKKLDFLSWKIFIYHKKKSDLFFLNQPTVRRRRWWQLGMRPNIHYIFFVVSQDFLSCSIYCLLYFCYVYVAPPFWVWCG